MPALIAGIPRSRRRIGAPAIGAIAAVALVALLSTETVAQSSFDNAAGGTNGLLQPSRWFASVGAV
jgi:hypothetical protein